MNKWLTFVNDWFQAKPHVEENAAERFERLWSDQEAGKSITFMAVAVNTSASDEIEDLGMSLWSKKSLAHLSYHWHIVEKVETKDVVYFGNSDSFNLGTTQPITISDVRTVLDDWSLSLSNECEVLCLVVYGKQTMGTLNKYWKTSVPIVLLDLEEAWRLNNKGPHHSTFREVASAVGGFEEDTAALDNAGNRAYHLLRLLKTFGKARGSTLQQRSISSRDVGEGEKFDNGRRE